MDQRLGLTERLERFSVAACLVVRPALLRERDGGLLALR
jgi:hypothetical protein